MSHSGTETSITARPIAELLEVGLPVVVDADPHDPNGERFRAIVRGWTEDESILFELTGAAANTAPVRKMRTCVFRFVADGVACAFPARIEELGQAGFFSYFMTAWPSEIKQVNVRKARRLDIKLDCIVMVNGKRDEIAGVVCDISSGGCALMLKARIEKDTHLFLSFQLPDGSQVTRIGASIRGVATDDDGYRIGCAFDTEDNAQLRLVELFASVSQQLLMGFTVQDRWVMMIGSGSPEGFVTRMEKGFQERAISLVHTRGLFSAFAYLSCALPAAIIMEHSHGPATSFDVYRILMSAGRFDKTPIYAYEPGPLPPNDVKQIASEASQLGMAGWMHAPEPALFTAEIIKRIS